MSDLYLPNGRPLPGIRFAPTREVLAVFYLKRQVLGKSLYSELIQECEIYNYDPPELPQFVCELVRDEQVWHFFYRPRKRSSTGPRNCRTTPSGYWKPTGKPRVVTFNNRTVAKIQTLIFYERKPAEGTRTDWVMHEYSLDDKRLKEQGIVQDTFVLCKIFQKPQQGPQNGAEYGAPCVEEEWEILDDAQEAHAGHGIQATLAADELNNSALTDTNIEDIAVSTENSSFSAFTSQSSLDFSTSTLVPYSSTSEQVFSGAVSSEIEHTGSASSAPPALYSDPITFELVYTGNISSTGLASSSHSLSSDISRIELVYPGPVSTAIDHTGLTSSAHSLSSDQPTFDSGNVCSTVNHTGLASSAYSLCSDLSAEYKDSPGSVSGASVTDHINLASSVPAFSSHPTTSKQACLSFSAHTPSIHPSTSKQVCPASSAPTHHPFISKQSVAVSGCVADRISLASLTPASSSHHPSTFEQAVVSSSWINLPDMASSAPGMVSTSEQQVLSGVVLGEINQTHATVPKVEIDSKNLQVTVDAEAEADDMDWDAIQLSDLVEISLPADGSDEPDCRGGMGVDDLKDGYYS